MTSASLVGVVRPNPRKFRQAVCHNISGSNRIEIDRNSSVTEGIVPVKIEPISTSEGCTRLWKSEIQFDGIFEGLGVQPHVEKVGTFVIELDWERRHLPR
jgi:hypothetical protein